MCIIPSTNLNFIRLFLIFKFHDYSLFAMYNIMCISLNVKKIKINNDSTFNYLTGISRMFNARMSEYERLPDKVDLQPCPMPVGISLTQVELEEIGRTLDCAFDFPRGTSTNTPMAKFDIRDEVCLKLCGYVSGTRFMGPYNGK